ncbi:MAG: helix-turn-helix domain-containing protein [Moraxella sp.]
MLKAYKYRIYPNSELISVSVLAKDSNSGCYGSQIFPHHNC